MPLTSPGPTAGNLAVLARSVSGAPVAADGTTLTDAHFAPADGVLCTGWKSVAIFCRITAPGASTVNVQALLRAGPQGAPNAWIVDDPAAGAGSAPDGAFVVVNVMGRLLFPRIHAVTGAPTAVAIYVAGWEPLGRAALS